MTKHLTATAVAIILVLAACDSFESAPSVEEAPALTAPADGAVMETGEVTLSWGTVENAGSYYVELSPHASGFDTDSLLVAQTRSTSISTDSLGVGTYFWRVSGVDGDGNLGPTSQARAFKLE